MVKMSNIAIIPARSGSKGLKDKNIIEFLGKPLIAHSIEAASRSGMFSEIMVSTDSKEYAGIAREYGASVPWLRSSELSGDVVGSWSVVENVLNAYHAEGRSFDTVCLLQPTSPLRSPRDIAEAYDFLSANKGNSVTGVCEVDHSPAWSMTLDETRSMDSFRAAMDEDGDRRQNLPQYYRINGAIYIRRLNYGKEGVSLLTSPEYAYIMDRSKSVDIDCLEDLVIAEAYAKLV